MGYANKDLKIDKEFESWIPPLTKEEFEQLQENCIERGIQDSIKVWQGIIIDGHNRYEIACKHNIHYDTTDLCFESRQSVIEWILNNQLGRRNLSAYDRSLIALKLEEMYKKNVKEKEKARKINHDFSQGGNVDSESKNTLKELSKKADVGHNTLNKVKHIEKKAAPEVKEKLKKGEITINKAFNDIKKEERRKETEKLKTFECPIVTGLYDVIYIDPPWKYDFSQSSNREIENNYPTMSLEELKEINIPAADNSVMLMWATAPKLIEAMELLKYWGFNYKTNMVWDKETIGMGYWCRGQHEILLIGTKGEAKPPEPENRFSSVFREKKTKHSKKPNEYYNMIEKMFPGKTLLEMFARQKINNNWNVWGNQAEGIVENELKNK